MPEKAVKGTTPVCLILSDEGKETRRRKKRQWARLKGYPAQHVEEEGRDSPTCTMSKRAEAEHFLKTVIKRGRS